MFTEDGRLLLNSGYLHNNSIWNIRTLQRKEFPALPEIASPAIATRGNLLAINSLGLFDLRAKKWLTEPSIVDPRHVTDLTRDVAFSPDGTLIVTVGNDGLLRFWGVAGGQPDTTAGEYSNTPGRYSVQQNGGE